MDGLPPLSQALAESRSRWQGFALLAADLLVETDARGRISFVAPEDALGHPPGALLGRPAACLLSSGSANPFAAAPVRGMRARLRRAGGGEAVFEISVVPVPEGLRAAGRDVTAGERQAEAAATALRRATALLGLLRLGTTCEGAAARLSAMLGGLVSALGCAGAALLRAEEQGWHMLRQAGGAPPDLPPPGTTWRRGGRLLMAPGAAGVSLLAWRPACAAGFDADEAEVIAGLALPLSALLAEAERERDLATLAETDPLTGLLNRRGFAAALAARLAAGAAGTLAYLDLDGLKPLNDRHGHDAGDAALRAIAARLRALPGLAARLGGDEFALWTEGQVPEDLGRPAALPGWPEAGPGAVRASLGLARAEPGDTPEALMTRADAAMYSRKRSRR